MACDQYDINHRSYRCLEVVAAMLGSGPPDHNADVGGNGP